MFFRCVLVVLTILGLAACGDFGVPALGEAAAAAPGGGSAWQDFDCPEAACTMQFPSKPTKEVREIKTVLGKQKLAIYAVELEQGRLAYLFSFTDYPPGFGKLATPEKALDGAREGMLKAVSGKLVREEKIKIDGFPGRYLVYSGQQDNQTYTGNAKVYLVGDRLYQLQVLGFPGAFNQANADKFFKSFKRVKPAGPPQN